MCLASRLGSAPAFVGTPNWSGLWVLLVSLEFLERLVTTFARRLFYKSPLVFCWLSKRDDDLRARDKDSRPFFAAKKAYGRITAKKAISPKPGSPG